MPSCALVERDADLAEQVITTDPTIDALQHEIEEKAILTIARRQPMAVDLRDIVGALRVSNDLERIGDLAKNIAKRVVVLDSDFHAAKGDARRRAYDRAGAGTQIKDVLDAYARRDLTGGPGGVARRRGGRRGLHRSVPRAPDLHDGGPAQHHAVHPSAVLRQEHRAHGRPRHEHRRNRLLHDRRPSDHRRAAEG